MSFALPADRAQRPVAVVGAGTLGRRIALMFAAHGTDVRIADPDEAQRRAAVEFVQAEAAGVGADGPPGAVLACEDRAQAVAGAWLVIEAVPERLELKREVFAELDREADPDAILATNSSSFPSSAFADAVGRPERLLNLHFQMPPQRTAVEVMSCGSTDPAVIEGLMEELPAYGFEPFRVLRESVGFIFNRIWAAIKRESLAVVAEGVATPEDVDRMWTLWSGAGPGPFRRMDAVGLDVVLAIEEHYAQVLQGLPESPRELLRELIEAGRLGVKSGRGFYDYA